MSQSTDAYLRQPEVAAALLRATRALLSEDGHENEVLFLEAGGLPCTVDGYWEQVETYIAQRSDADFSRGLCEKCVTSLYGEDISD